MVSTRGVKLKFMEGERVLCYEPDPTKAKVLYDSKVLDIIINKDPKGKKSIEYLIHFQGWNSSWDRCVKEEFVLKDTPENRQLQKDLAEKSQLHIGAYLYRKERKKNRSKSVAGVGAVQGATSEDGSSGSPTRPDTDTTSGEESSMEDDSISIELSEEIRTVLENDYHMINKNKLLKSPADPNVIQILETYWKHYVTNLFCGLNEKPNPRFRNVNNQNKPKPEDIQKKINICKEVLDGIRIYFDTIVNEHLLYPQERAKISTKMAIYLSPMEALKVEVKSEDRHHDNQNIPHLDECNKNGRPHIETGVMNSRRRTLRSNQKQEVQTNGNSSTDCTNVAHNVIKASSSIGSTSSDVGPMARALAWQLLPEHVYQQDPPPPSLVYGATHLLRLFVKLPMFLTAANIPELKMKILLRHFDLFLDYMAERKDWYGDRFYYEAET